MANFFLYSIVLRIDDELAFAIERKIYVKITKYFLKDFIKRDILTAKWGIMTVYLRICSIKQLSV